MIDYLLFLLISISLQLRDCYEDSRCYFNRNVDLVGSACPFNNLLLDLLLNNSISSV